MKKVIQGNHAVSWGVQLARTEVISAYPITPQTTIVEELSEMVAAGAFPARFIKVESEHSAMACCIGASTAGARTFTATSSHGLLLMHECLHWAAAARLPVVMANVNRAVGPGWNIWADQTDSLSQRDTGWLQFYCESNQEVLDTTLIAFRIAEQVNLPVMISYDAFFLSHTSEVVDIPEQELVDRFLPRRDPPFKLDPANPYMFNGLIAPDVYFEERYTIHRAVEESLAVQQATDAEFESLFGRRYRPLMPYRADDAELLLVTAGTTCSVAQLAVDEAREAGIRVGLIKLRSFRPFPGAMLRELVSGRKVAVIDRNLSPGLGGIFAQEVRAALAEGEGRPPVFPFVAGLGGRDITPATVLSIIRHAAGRERPGSPVEWVGLKRPAGENGL